MKKIIAAFIFGASLSYMIGCISDFHINDWQWWAAFLPVAIIGIIYANIDDLCDLCQQ